MDSMNAALRFGGEKHRKILQALLARKKPARDKIVDRQTDFERHDELFDAYLPDTAEMRLRKDKFRAGEPDYYTVVIPYSYAALLTAHTYWTTVFLGRTPVFQFTGRHGEPQMKIQAVEALMDYQLMVGEMLGPLYHWMHDAPKYGYGVLYDCWDKQVIQHSTIKEVPLTLFGQEIPGRTKRVKETQRTVGYVGNQLINVHPSHFWYDWRRPLADFQRGEFVARYIELSWNELVKGKEIGKYFNLDAVEKHTAGGAKYDDFTGGASAEYPHEESVINPDIASVKVQKGFEIIIELIPRDWNLGNSTYPEKWLFTVIDDRIIVEGRPYARAHGKFPVSVIQSDFDAYKLYPVSLMDRLMPMSDILTWLINQHFYNVRAAMSNNFIFDPSKVVVKDLYRRGVSKLIRLKESAYGTDIAKVIQQIPVTDVTGRHFNDIQNVTEMLNRVYGGNDNLMGQIHPGGRKTATEIRTSSTFGVNRLKTVAEYWSATGFVPLAQRLLQNTQQLYDEEMQFRIAGDLAGEAQFINVSPDQIGGMYDFVPVDGTMPIDRYAQANLWRETLMGAAKVPQIAGRYDIGRMFGWMSQLAGLKNIKQFEIQVMPDEAAMMGAQQGNLVPMAKRSPEALASVEPGQISGMGRTS